MAESGIVDSLVLIVEDNLINQLVAEGLLRLLGYSADIAENGQAALKAMRDKPYRIVLLDIHMPELDGYETARRIRLELPADRQPHIIALTADVMPGTRETCLAAGMDDFLVKPVSKASLADALQKAHALPA